MSSSDGPVAGESESDPPNRVEGVQPAGCVDREISEHERPEAMSAYSSTARHVEPAAECNSTVDANVSKVMAGKRQNVTRGEGGSKSKRKHPHLEDVGDTEEVAVAVPGE